METINNPTEGLLAIQNFLLDRPEEAPQDVRDILRGMLDPTQQRSPSETACNAAELIYARRDECGAELLEIGAQLATMAANYRLFGLGVNGRGYAVAYTIRSMPNVATQVPFDAAPVAPEPLEQYAPAPEPAPGPSGPDPAGPPAP